MPWTSGRESKSGMLAILLSEVELNNQFELVSVSGRN